jgi:hypothetical protein
MTTCSADPAATITIPPMSGLPKIVEAALIRPTPDSKAESETPRHIQPVWRRLNLKIRPADTRVGSIRDIPGLR